MNTQTPFNRVPSLNREIKVHEKRIKTLNNLETSVIEFSECVKQIYIGCPFGEDSLEVQPTVVVMPYYDVFNCDKSRDLDDCSNWRVKMFIGSNLTYPLEALQNDWQGTVIVKFVVRIA